MDISSIRRSDRLSPDVPLGELLGDVAGQAQGIMRTEVRLAFAQARQEVSVAARRVALIASASVVLFIGVVLSIISAVLVLSTLMATWMAVLIIAAVAFIVAFALLGAARSRT